MLGPISNVLQAARQNADCKELESDFEFKGLKLHIRSGDITPGSSEPLAYSPLGSWLIA